jgi:C4-dicarboxylate-specific signal transduction histidine kinase
VDRSWHAAINRETPYDIEHRIVVDGEVRWVREKAEVDFSEDGRPIRGSGFVQDITKRIRTDEEQNKLRESLAHVSRVATVGELTSALAHEINQPLAAILANAQAARHIIGAEQPDINELKEALDDIIADDKRAREVIRRVRSMLKGRSSEVEKMDLNETVRDAVKLVERESSHRNIPIRLDLEADMPRVLGDRIQIGQIVINLIINAMEAIGDDPGIPRQITIRSRRDDNGEVIVSVQDTGKGFDPASIGTLFEPFHTTKAGGLGLGLSISRSIIESHGGRLFASPNKDRGSTFSFSLSGCKEE